MPIVAAVGSASVARGGKDMARAIEQAMANAVMACATEGVTDPDAIRARQLAARDAVKQMWKGGQ